MVCRECSQSRTILGSKGKLAEAEAVQARITWTQSPSPQLAGTRLIQRRLITLRDEPPLSIWRIEGRDSTHKPPQDTRSSHPRQRRDQCGRSSDQEDLSVNG